MNKRLLLTIASIVFLVLTSHKSTQTDAFRIYPYLQIYGDGKIQMTWFSNVKSSSSIKLVNDNGEKLLEREVISEAVPEIYYTSKEKRQEIPGLNQGSWLKDDGVFRYRLQVDLAAGEKLNYEVTLGTDRFSGTFRMPESKGNWEKIRFIALADSETDPKGRVTNRAWYPGIPLLRPFSIPNLWKEKFGTTTEQGYEIPNYFLTEEEGYKENLKIIGSRNPNFILMPGDLVQGGAYQPAWDEFFRHNAGTMGKGLSNYAILPSLGNWEAYGGINGGYGTNEKGEFNPVLGRKRFHSYFETPTEDPLQKHRQSYYRVDYGPITILTLDSSNGTPDQSPSDFDGQTKLKGKEYTVPGTDTQENFTEAAYNAAGGKDLSGFGPGSDQYIWLEENLKDAHENGQLIFVQYHHIAYSSGEHGVPLNHELSIGQVGTPLRILNPILEKYGVLAVFSGHDEIFERSFVDEDGDGNGIMYYDVGVSGDGMRGEKRDWSGNPFNTLNYNPYRKWTADQDSKEVWNTSVGNPILKDGGKHYGHLEVNVEKKLEGDQEFALIDFIPVYVFPVLDQNYNLQKVERRIYNDKVSLKLPLRITTATPIFKDSISLYLDDDGTAFPEVSQYLKSGYSPNYNYQFSRDPVYTCTDLGVQKMNIKVSESGKEKWTGTVKVNVMDNIPPKVQVKNFFGGVMDIVTSQAFELKPEYFIENISDNCGENLEIEITPKSLSCNDIGATYPTDVHIWVKDKSGNYTSAVSKITVDAEQSKRISINGPNQGVIGSTVNLTLGSEFDFTVEAWYKGDVKLTDVKSKVFTVSETGSYRARLHPINGCSVFSDRIEVTFIDEVGVPGIQNKIELGIDSNGKASLKPEEVFTEWPISSGFTFDLSRKDFNCENLGTNKVIVRLIDPMKIVTEKEIEVLVRDEENPVLTTRNIEAVIDLSIGALELKAEDFITSLSDNCGIKEVTLSRQSISCQDVGKELVIEVKAVDKSGNLSQQQAKLNVKLTNSNPVIISGSSVICAGKSQVLELKSEAVFEVVEWRRNGTVIGNSDSKKLEIGAAGSYHAIIRYLGGCLQETAPFEVKIAATPAGEIVVEGNVLKAPAGEYNYQWLLNGNKLEGSNQGALTVNQPGEYAVELTTAAGCTTRLVAVTVTVSGILNPGQLISEELKIYPNPVSDEVALEVFGDNEFEKDTWQIYDENGKAVGSQAILVRHTPSLLQLNISQLAPGTYVIISQSNNQKIFIGKILKVD